MKRRLRTLNAQNEMSLLRITLRRRRRTSTTHRNTSLTRTMRRHCGLWVSLTTNINYKHVTTVISTLPFTEELERKEKEAEKKRQEKRSKALHEAALKALKKKRKTAQDTPVQSQDVQDTPEKSDEQSGSQVSLRISYFIAKKSLSAIFTRSSMRNASRATSQI